MNLNKEAAMENFYYDINIKGNRIRIEEDGLFWIYEVESDVEKAAHIIDDAIGHWYDIDSYPDYESICIGDAIDIELEEAGINYSYLGGGYVEEED